MNAFKAFCDDRADTRQRGSFCGPIAAGAPAVVGACHHDELRSRTAVPLDRVMDGQSLATGLHDSPHFICLLSGTQLVAYPGIAEGPPVHDLKVAAPRRILVEIPLRYTMPEQVTASGAFSRNRTRG